MRIFTSAPGLKPWQGAGCVCTGFLLAAGLLTAQEPLANPEPAADVQPAGPQHLPAGPEDGLLPIGRVVPRAHIVLKEKERLPDLGGERTFAAYGSARANNFPWLPSGPPVPMYGVAYHPIYFEDMNLERCGLSYGCCLQPIVSGLHFYIGFAVLPYKVLVAPPRSYVFSPIDTSPDCRFSCCENFFGVRPSRTKRSFDPPVPKRSLERDVYGYRSK